MREKDRKDVEMVLARVGAGQEQHAAHAIVLTINREAMHTRSTLLWILAAQIALSICILLA